MTSLAALRGVRAEEFFTQMLRVEALLIAADESDMQRLGKELSELAHPLLGSEDEKKKALIDLQIWASNYAQPLGLMLEFRNRVVHGAPASDEELEEVTKAAETAVQALLRRLGRSSRQTRG